MSIYRIATLTTFGHLSGYVAVYANSVEEAKRDAETAGNRICPQSSIYRIDPYGLRFCSQMINVDRRNV